MKENMEDKNLTKACVLPFSSFNAYPSGMARACPMSGIIKDIDTRKTSIDESFNSDDYKKLRTDMLCGTENEICKGCYDMEKWGAESFRKKANDKHLNDYNITIEDSILGVEVDGFKEADFIKLDLRPSNICNFKCRTCSSDFSTKWIPEARAYNKEFGYEDSDVLKDGTISKPFGISSDSIKNLKEIYIAGGESLYMEEMYKFLEGIENKNELQLNVHTNFSILKFKKYDVFKLLEDFKEIMFFISTDGAGELGEYVRTGLNWDNFSKNVETLLEIEKDKPQFRHNFHFTSSILNVFHFYDFLSILKDKNWIESDSQVHFFPVKWPTYYNSINFDMNDEIIKYYRDGLDLVESDFLKIQIESFMEYIGNVDMSQDMKKGTNTNIDGIDKHAQKQFSEIVNFGNTYNKTKLPKELNYLKKFI